MKDQWQRIFTVGSEDQIRAFATSINDDNPLHHDNEAARKARLHGIIAPGVMIIGFISSAIAQELPGVMVTSLNAAFLKPVYAYSSITVVCYAGDATKYFAQLNVEVYSGTELVTKGECFLKLPRSAKSAAALTAP